MIEQQSIFSNGFEHHLRTAGTGEDAMILLHGWPETSYTWRHIMGAFTKNYQMIAPDLRGIGDTGKPDGPYDKATVAEDIWAIMDDQGIHKAILVGHDIGARIAMRMTLDDPDRVASLVIINGRYPPLGGLRTSCESQAMERWYFYFHQYPDLVEALVSKDVRAYSQPGSIRGACSHYQAALNEDTAQWVADVGKKISTPTLVVWGEDDPVSPTFYTDGYEQVFTNLNLQFFAQCGHFPQEEKPQETIAAMQAFMQR